MQMRSAELLLQPPRVFSASYTCIREPIASLGPSTELRLAFENRGTLSISDTELRDEVKCECAESWTRQRWCDNSPHHDSSECHEELTP